jgi:type I restriction enzyme S subunit
MSTVLWPLKPISDLCSEVVDCVNKTAPSVDGATAFKMIRTTNVRSGRVDTSSVKYVEEEVYEKWIRRGAPRAGDVILTREAPLGEVGMFRGAEKIFLGQRLVMYRANPCIADNRFLLYALMSPWVQAEIRSLGSGATVEHMRVPDCERLAVPAPPLPVQRAIGSALGSLDDLIENNRRRIEILEEMARLLYREWFVHFRFPGHEDVELVDSELGLIPKGWEVGRLAELCSLVMGQSPKSEFYNADGEGLPFHQGVTDFGFRYPTHRKWTTVDKRIAETGDVLFSVRAPVGRINVAPDRMVVGRGLSAIRAHDGRQEFLLLQMKDQFLIEDSIGGGTIFNAVTKTDMERIKLLRPPGPLIDRFEQFVVPMASLGQNLTQQNRVLREARDLLLPRLVSGELDVSDLNLEGVLP